LFGARDPDAGGAFAAARRIEIARLQASVWTRASAQREAQNARPTTAMMEAAYVVLASGGGIEDARAAVARAAGF